MKRRNNPLFAIIAFWFGLGVLLSFLCSLELALFIALVLVLILAFIVMRIGC